MVIAELLDALANQILKTDEIAAVFTDLDGQIVFANPAAQKILGLSGEELCTHHLRDFFTKTDQEHGIPEQEFAHARQTDYAPDERWHWRSDKSLFWAAGAMIALRNGDNELVGYVKLFRARTHQKRTEEALEQTHAQMSAFAHTAAHELQEPLRTVSLLLQLTQRNLPTEMNSVCREYVTQAIETARSAQTLVTGLLELGRMSNAPSETVNVDMNRLFDLSVSTLRAAIAAEKGFMTRGVLPTVRGDAFDLQRLLLNLMSNALKYHGAQPPRVVVTGESDGQQVTFRVADNGIGIAPENLERVFEPFQRVSPEKKRFAGTGLGLAMCRAIVKRHGGKIWAESTEGRGTTICFTLPASAAAIP